MVAIGAIREALDIFLELRMWEKAVICYQIMNEKNEALQLINEHLQSDPSPRLHCVMAELKNDPSYYHIAWELSQNKYSRAVEALGMLSYNKEKVRTLILFTLISFW